MEYQKTINLLANTSNQYSKFSTKDWVEINDESRGKYKTNSQIEVKTSKFVIIVMLTYCQMNYNNYRRSNRC